MHNENHILSRLHAGAQRGEKKTHSVQEEQGGEGKESDGQGQPGTNSVIPISRHHVANLSLETPTILNRYHTRIISKHTINTLVLSPTLGAFPTACTHVDFPSDWRRTLINRTPTHSTAISSLSIPATIYSLTATRACDYLFFPCMLSSASKQSTINPTAVETLCPSRFTSLNPATSQPTS